MTIDLPWFDGGDNTSPEIESPWHRYHGDYYQLYNLIFNANNALPNQAVGLGSLAISPTGLLAEPNVILLKTNNVGIQEFNPTPRFSEISWAKKWLDFCLGGFSKTVPEVNDEYGLLDWPLEITRNVQVSYLVLGHRDLIPPKITGDADLTFRSRIRDWYDIRYESLKKGQLWIPPYPILHNSLSSDVDFLPESFKKYLSIDDWILGQGEITINPNALPAISLKAATHDYWNQGRITNDFNVCYFGRFETTNEIIQPEFENPTLDQIWLFNENSLSFVDNPMIEGTQIRGKALPDELIINLVDARWLQNDGNSMGYNMPDSVRMIEIHRALNAGFYGNGQEKVITKKDDVFGAPEIVDATLITIADGEDIELRYTSLAEYLGQVNYLNAALLGLHNFPIQRLPTWQPLGDATEPNLITCFSEYLIVNDYETQIKLGIYPLTTYNYAAFTDAKEPSEVVYSNSGDLLADLYALETRASVLLERSALQTYRTDINTIEIAKAIGSPFKRFEAIWDYGTTDVLQFDGAASIAMGIAGISAYLADNLANTIPLEIQQQADLRRSELMGIE